MSILLNKFDTAVKRGGLHGFVRTSRFDRSFQCPSQTKTNIRTLVYTMYHCSLTLGRRFVFIFVAVLVAVFVSSVAAAAAASEKTGSSTSILSSSSFLSHHNTNIATPTSPTTTATTSKFITNTFSLDDTYYHSIHSYQFHPLV